MSRVVDSLRKKQKVIILAVAMSIISLYLLPLDQISNAISDDKLHGIDNAISHIQATQKRISENENIPDAVQYRIVNHLGDVIDHLIDVKYRLKNL